MVRNREWGHDRRLLYTTGDEKGQDVQFLEPQFVRIAVPKWLASKALTVSSTALGLDSALRQSHEAARIVVETDQIRYWLSDKIPTASDGILVEKGDILLLETAEEVRDFRVIRVTTDVTLMVEYGNYG
ncbi:hypothetical protein LCGC14_1340880 [marine sediment metagenome]|uniref:Uncharacterized protein n=1 Tax=marine sediment metagenome TaxID=412755 RepID=A0A0F9NG38_9ZZZZ